LQASAFVILTAFSLLGAGVLGASQLASFSSDISTPGDGGMAGGMMGSCTMDHMAYNGMDCPMQMDYAQCIAMMDDMEAHHAECQAMM